MAGGYTSMTRSVSVFTLLWTITLFSSVQAQTSITSTATDRQSVNVTIYNSNIALVRDVRLVSLPVGRLDLRFADVAALIQPETVHLTSTNAAETLSVLEQNYRYDLLNPSKLL